jgi:hypothetical protein
MGGEPGPTAYRAVRDPLEQIARSNIRTDEIIAMIREMRKPVWMPQNNRKLRRKIMAAGYVNEDGTF